MSDNETDKKHETMILDLIPEKDENVILEASASYGDGKIPFETEEKPKNKIIVLADDFLKRPVYRFERYFELEGSNFPDLFPRDNCKQDDIDSKVDAIAPTRAGKFYSNLLTAIVNQEKKTGKKVRALDDLFAKVAAKQKDLGIADPGKKGNF